MLHYIEYLPIFQQVKDHLSLYTLPLGLHHGILGAILLLCRYMLGDSMKKHQEINQVALSGLAGNILLLIAKITIALITHSQSMLADGFNSAGDVFASTMTYIGNKISSQPGDVDHPYGHGKAEYIFSMIISFSLLLVAFSIFTSSLNALIGNNEFTYSIWLVIIGIGTIIIKLALYFFAIKVGHKHNSLLAMANAEDHRNDVFITSLTLLSILGGYFGIFFIDSIGGILIAFWIAFTAFKIFIGAYNVLMDTNVDDSLIAELQEMIDSIEGVDHIDSIHSTPVGLNFLLIIKVSVDAHLTVYKGHEIASQVRQIVEQLDNVEEVIVHVNPAQYHPARMKKIDIPKDK